MYMFMQESGQNGVEIIHVHVHVTGCTGALGVMNLIRSVATTAQCSQRLLNTQLPGRVCAAPCCDEGQKPKNSSPGFAPSFLWHLALDFYCTKVTV